MNEIELKKIYNLLKEVHFLYELSIDEIIYLIKGLNKIIFNKGKTVIRQGDTGDSFFLVAEGKVSVWTKTSAGSKVLLKYLGEGSYFGEMSLLTGERRNATVISEGKTVLYSLSKEKFKHILTNNPAVVESISHVVSSRNDQLSREGDNVIKKESLLKKMANYFNIE